MKATYDKDADAMYVEFLSRDIEETIEVSNRVFVDLDSEKNIVGIEILFVSKVFAESDFSDIQLQLPYVGEIVFRSPEVLEKV